MQERVKTADSPEPKKKKVILAIDAELAAGSAKKGLDLSLELERSLRRSLGAGLPLTPAECENLKALERYVAEHGPCWDDQERD